MLMQIPLSDVGIQHSKICSAYLQQRLFPSDEFAGDCKHFLNAVATFDYLTLVSSIPMFLIRSPNDKCLLDYNVYHPLIFMLMIFPLFFIVQFVATPDNKCLLDCSVYHRLNFLDYDLPLLFIV